ncbi:hypothetical protein Q4E93_21175 [Flavitalea sp. BT771]|uniref:hypothetical protein n=1 Tax=Flavitalea sp. BT771 TaxID=3063329 RepID=UPI0026E27A75|nr:hypothetical protein [Flavitalea sp. BT771]MDO6433135.1 hypothetical protein [Flavitalea sp. BT771]MDV6221589.1 hypothetical protein [Flavitalea sp. BT771]
MFTAKWSFLFITCFFSMVATSQTVSHSAVDTSLYAILDYDSSVDMAMITGFYKARTTTLSIDEINDMEQIVDSSYQEYNRKNPRRQLLGPLSTYKRQYVAIVNEKGQKEVWINFFCSSFGAGWKHHVLIVDDGGVCFFQLTINLYSRRAGELIPNGVA